MGVDGFSMASLGMPKDITSAQAAASAEQLAQTSNEKVVGKIDRALNKKINNDEEKQQQKRQFFEDGLVEEDEEEKDEHDSDEEASENEDVLKSVKNFSPPVINDPENVTIRFNNAKDRVELYNKLTNKIIESIKIKDFVDMITKLDYNLGIIVNKEI